MRMAEMINEELLDQIAGGANTAEALNLNQLIEFAEGYEVRTLEDMKAQLQKLGLSAAEEDILKGFNQYMASFRG